MQTHTRAHARTRTRYPKCARDRRLVDLIFCLHVLEGRDRSRPLINPPDAVVSNSFTLVKFWVEVNGSVLLVRVFFPKVTHAHRRKHARP